MRSFSTLDTVTLDEETGVMTVSGSEAGQPTLAVRREGGYIAISVAFGPLEIALRPRYQEFEHVLSRLRSVSGLQTTRQVGTGESHLGLGLRDDGALVMRPTLVADATGHISINLILSSDARTKLYAWLAITPVAE